VYQVEQEEPTHQFGLAWQAAGRHLQSCGGEGINWLRASLDPPLAEHLSFRIGNRLFFVYVEPTDGTAAASSKPLFLQVSKEATAIPCVIPMERCAQGYNPMYGGWGLRHAVSGNQITPSDLVDDENIPMSDWEIHDFAIQIVTNHIRSSGNTVLSSQPSPHIDPSIWFRDQHGPAYVIVRAARYPVSAANQPSNVQDIARSCARISQRGYFGSVSFANASDLDEPLFRGHGVLPRFSGLEELGT
jgi:hypothetical protein